MFTISVKKSIIEYDEISHSRIPTQDTQNDITETALRMLGKEFGIAVPMLKESYDVYIYLFDRAIDANTYGGRFKTGEARDSLTQTHFFLTLHPYAQHLNDVYLNLINYIYCAIYRDVTRYLCNDSIMHDNTRGCIFDRCNEYIEDITFLVQNPTICSKQSGFETCSDRAYCDETIAQILDSSTAYRFPIGEQYVTLLKHGLRKRKQTLYLHIEMYFSRKPFVILMIGILLSLISIVLSIILYLLQQ